MYARYNPELTADGLRRLGICDFKLDDLLRMDLATPENITKLAEIGAAAGKQGAFRGFSQLKWTSPVRSDTGDPFEFDGI